jgi:hypothetical protein
MIKIIFVVLGMAVAGCRRRLPRRTRGTVDRGVCADGSGRDE